MLDDNWIKNFKASALSLESKYLRNSKQDFSKLIKGEACAYTFYGILELARFLIGVFFKFDNPENKPSVNIWNFTYSIVGLKDEDYAVMKEGFSKARYMHL